MFVINQELILVQLIAKFFLVENNKGWSIDTLFDTMRGHCVSKSTSIRLKILLKQARYSKLSPLEFILLLLLLQRMLKKNKLQNI